MRHWRLGRWRIEGAPASSCSETGQKPMRAAPADRPRGPRNGDSPEPRRARRWSFPARPTPAFAAPALQQVNASRRAPNHARLLKRRHRLPPLALAHPRNRRQPSRKILSLHRIAPSIRPILNKSTANAIRAKLSSYRFAFACSGLAPGSRRAEARTLLPNILPPGGVPQEEVLTSRALQRFGRSPRRGRFQARVRLVARPSRSAFAGRSDRPVRATPQSTSASPAQADGAMGSASATAPAMTPIRGTM